MKKRSTRAPRCYIDTSVLVAAHTREPHTDLAQGWLSTQSGGNLIVSCWTLVECDSALAIKRRRGEIDAAGQEAAMADIESYAAHFRPYALAAEEDYQRARLLCRHAASGLRAGDALHLAMALRLKLTHFATLDILLASNAATHGLSAAFGLEERYR